MSNWINFGSSSKNEEYIEKLLQKLKLTQYNFTFGSYGELDLYVSHNLNTYKIIVNELKEVLVIYKKSIYRKAQKNKKEYLIPVCEMGGYDCWLKALKYIISE